MSSPDPAMPVEDQTDANDGARRSSRKRRAPENFMDAGMKAAVMRDEEEDDEEEEEDDGSDDEPNPPPKKRKTTTAAPTAKRGRPVKEKPAPVKRRAKTTVKSTVDTAGDGLVKDDNGLFSTSLPLITVSVADGPLKTRSCSRISRSSSSSRIGSPSTSRRGARRKKYTSRSLSFFCSGYVSYPSHAEWIGG